MYLKDNKKHIITTQVGAVHVPVRHLVRHAAPRQAPRPCRLASHAHPPQPYPTHVHVRSCPEYPVPVCYGPITLAPTILLPPPRASPQTEHKCVLDSCRWLQHRGWDVTFLPVGKPRLRVGCPNYAYGWLAADAGRSGLVPGPRLPAGGRGCGAGHGGFQGGWADPWQKCQRLHVDMQPWGTSRLPHTAPSRALFVSGSRLFLLLELNQPLAVSINAPLQQPATWE